MPATVKIIWTSEEDERFLHLMAIGKSQTAIADIVGRARSTVGQRLRDLKAAKAAGITQKYSLSDAARAVHAEQNKTIAAMLKRGLSHAEISDETGLARSTLRDRIAQIMPKPKPVEKESSRRSLIQGRPPGPVPRNPGPAPSPHAPWWRKCLGESCGKLFWSASSLNRICPRCKGGGNELVRGGTAEFALHL